MNLFTGLPISLAKFGLWLAWGRKVSERTWWSNMIGWFSNIFVNKRERSSNYICDPLYVDHSGSQALARIQFKVVQSRKFLGPNTKFCDNFYHTFWLISVSIFLHKYYPNKITWCKTVFYMAGIVKKDQISPVFQNWPLQRLKQNHLFTVHYCSIGWERWHIGNLFKNFQFSQSIFLYMVLNIWN